jgi:hypothetical protein
VLNGNFWGWNGIGRSKSQNPTADFWGEWHLLEMIAEIAGKLTRGMNPMTPPGATP